MAKVIQSSTAEIEPANPVPISVKPTDYDEDIEASKPASMHKKKTAFPTSPRSSLGMMHGDPNVVRGSSLYSIFVSDSPTNNSKSFQRKCSDLHEEALAPGGEVNIWELKNIGFIMQYFAIGIIYGGLPATVYGVFLGYLNVPGYVYATAGVITTLPWSFKFVFGMLNDCVPIFGYRRKPYMVIGWLLCCAMLCFLSTHSLPEPYYCINNTTGEYIKKEYDADLDKMVPAKPCNPGASEKGGEYALLMCLAALGYVVADVAADGLMVQYAQREPTEKRGGTQTMIYLVRTIGVVVSVALVGLCMNGKIYQGTFDWTLSYNQICGILAIPAGIMVPVSWLCVQETKVGSAEDPDTRVNSQGQLVVEKRTFRSYLNQSWELLSNKAFFYVVLFNFFEPFVGRISTTAGGYVKKEWAGVQNIQNQMFTLVSCLVFAAGLYAVKTRFLNYSWRKMLFITTVLLNVTDMIIAFLTIFDIVRNQYFYLGETILDEIPAAANFVVGTYIIVEMADVGNEGLTYGLLTTISNLGTPFSRAVGNQVFAMFKPNLSDPANYVKDAPAFRNTVALSFGISYLFSFLALGFLFLLPTQKAMAQERKRTWGKSSTYAYITCGLLFCALCYSLSVNFLAMFPSTMCLKFAGGTGC